MYKLGDDELERSLPEKDLCNWVDGEFNRSQQCALATKRVNCVLGCIKHSITSWSAEVIVLLCSVLVRPDIEYCVQFWVSQNSKDTVS